MSIWLRPREIREPGRAPPHRAAVKAGAPKRWLPQQDGELFAGLLGAIAPGSEKHHRLLLAVERMIKN